MELSKKTTILFSEQQFRYLKELAGIKNSSIGELIRKACEKVYGKIDESEAAAAVDRLSELGLPTGSIDVIKQEIVHSKPDPL